MATSYHESNLSEAARDVHRALVSLQEELEAADWYHQRIDTTNDEELSQILAHNRDEELEHAAMLLEYLRRNGAMPIDDALSTYLFTKKPVTEIEDEAEGGGENEDAGSDDLGIGSGK